MRKYLFYLIVPCSMFHFPSSMAAQGTWVPKADLTGALRASAVAFSIGTKGYIATGTGQTGDLKDLWEWDQSTDAWTQKADLPAAPRYSAVGFSIGTKGYVGLGYDGTTYFNDLWAWNQATNVWTQKANFPSTGRYSGVGISIGGYGFAGLGSDGTYRKDFYQYDPVVDSWTAKANFPGAARVGAVGFSIGNKGYVGTGDTAALVGGPKKDFWEYNSQSGTWVQKADFGGTARRAAVGFSIGKKGYIGTGIDNGFANDLWEWDQASDTWIQKANFGGIARYAAVGFSIGCLGYVGTGWTNVCCGMTSRDLWSYSRLNVPPAICLVTVDSLSKFNNIIWDKTPYSAEVDSFVIYREITTNNYQVVGKVSRDSLSLFEDTTKTKYFPNTGDPNAGTYRYKIALMDTCGNISSMGPYHNTIFMTNNSGNFSWPQLYTIEGGPNPVNNYLLMRDNLSNGTWIPVNSVAGTQQSVNDPAYSTWVSTASWRIHTNWSITCTPSSKYPDPQGTIKTTKSNTFKQANPNVVSENAHKNSVNVYPNPSDGKFAIQMEGEGISFVRICNMFGQLVYADRFDGTKKEIALQLGKGIYQVQVETPLGRTNQKISIR